MSSATKSKENVEEQQQQQQPHEKQAEKQQRAIQNEVKRSDSPKYNDGDDEPAMQCGARTYPEPPYKRAKHINKPGLEAETEPKPMYDAPYYVGSKKLQDQVALVTGGDSGIGRSVCVLFAREGADVAICYLHEEQKDAEVVKQAVEKEGRRAILLPGDIRDERYCKDAVARTVKEFGRINVLVNNAAFQVHTNHIEDLSTEHFDVTLKTNLYGTFFMTKYAIPHMPYGSAIIQSGSKVAMNGSKAMVDYSMTKAALHTFTRSLSQQLIPNGIRVNAVAPGPVWTPLNPSDKETDDVQKFGEHAPMKRAAQPEEIAPAYVFLASSHCSSYITGEILPVIGGY